MHKWGFRVPRYVRLLGGLGFNKPPLPLACVVWWSASDHRPSGKEARSQLVSVSRPLSGCHTRPPSLRGEPSPPVQGPRDPVVSAYSSEGALTTRLGPPGTAGRPRPACTGQRPVLSRGRRGGLTSSTFSGLHAVGPPHAASRSFLLGSSRVGRRLSATLTVENVPVPHPLRPRPVSARVGTPVAPCSRQRLRYRRPAHTEFSLTPHSRWTLLPSHSARSGFGDADLSWSSCLSGRRARISAECPPSPVAVRRAPSW